MKPGPRKKTASTHIMRARILDEWVVDARASQRKAKSSTTATEALVTPTKRKR